MNKFLVTLGTLMITCSFYIGYWVACQCTGSEIGGLIGLGTWAAVIVTGGFMVGYQFEQEKNK